MNLASNILVTFVTRVGAAGLALASSIFLARFLGPDDRGLFALILIVPELAVTFGLLGFDQAYAVYAGLEPKKRVAMCWQAAAIGVVVGGVSGFGGWWYLATGAPGFEALSRAPHWIYLVALCAVPAKMVTVLWLAVLRGMNRILMVSVFGLGTKSASLILVVVTVGGLGLGVGGAVWSDTTIGLGSVILLLGALRWAGVWGRPSFDWALGRRAGRFAVAAYLGTVMSYLNYRVDQVIVAVLLAPAQLAFYVLAVDLVERVWLLTGAVSTALLPHLTNAPERDPGLPAVVARHVIIWTGLGSGLLFALAGILVPLFYSSAFADVVAPLRWLLPGVLTLSVGKVLVAELLAREQVRVTMWIAAAAVVINVIGNLALIPSMGISGAAAASSISYSVVAVLVTVAYVRETGISVWMIVPRPSDARAYIGLCRHFWDLRRVAQVRV